MQLNEVGWLFHRQLGAVRIDSTCVTLQAQNPDSHTAFVKHNDEIREVSRALLVNVDSAEAIADEMRDLLWRRVDPPIWWAAIQDHVIADGALGTMRAHMVRGHVEPGRIVANCHVIGEADWPNALYSDVPSHLSAA